MSPSGHFIARVDRLATALTGGAAALLCMDQVEREFTALVAPVIGLSPAEHLAGYIQEHIEKNATDSLRKMGYIAAFFLREYDDASMPLEAEDWQKIQQTIEDASEEIDITVLTSLMDGLLSRRLLKRR
ncbi:MAG: hypothetical protein LBE17_09470 [Treponema sp.]|jgi:hypothetical protein|nr:hypothetical protein [Treponema sp.]